MVKILELFSLFFGLVYFFISYFLVMLKTAQSYATFPPWFSYTLSTGKKSIRVLDIFHTLFMEASDHLLFLCLLFLRFLYSSDKGSSQHHSFLYCLKKIWSSIYWIMGLGDSKTKSWISIEGAFKIRLIWLLTCI